MSYKNGEKIKVFLKIKRKYEREIIDSDEKFIFIKDKFKKKVQFAKYDISAIEYE